MNLLNKVTALLTAIFLALAPSVAFAQYQLTLADQYLLYAVHWNGSLVNGPVVSIAIPTGTTAVRSTYPIGVQVLSSAPVSVSVTMNSVNHPTTTAVVPVPLNTNVPADFRGYVNSNAGFGNVVTQEPAANFHSIDLQGVKFGSGRLSVANRNINIHISAANATGYVTWKVAQK